MSDQRRIAWRLYRPVDQADEWHPLSGLAPPEIIPDTWDGPHVALRLADGLRTLRQLPAAGRVPHEYGSAWPEALIEYRDLAQYADDAAWKADRAARSNHRRPRPSPVAIERMEAALGWPGRHLAAHPQLLRAVTMVAHCRSYHRDSDHAARRLGLPRHVLRRWHGEGCDLIARGLLADRVPVF
ncbi:MAG: hypothetical protein IT537_30560 [Hyphomicrobiales bacterium]|nr:hypothetical protein [Hyphomicrobiales bacterium]